MQERLLAIKNPETVKWFSSQVTGEARFELQVPTAVDANLLQKT